MTAAKKAAAPPPPPKPARNLLSPAARARENLELLIRLGLRAEAKRDKIAGEAKAVQADFEAALDRIAHAATHPDLGADDLELVVLAKGGRLIPEDLFPGDLAEVAAADLPIPDQAVAAAGTAAAEQYAGAIEGLRTGTPPPTRDEALAGAVTAAVATQMTDAGVDFRVLNGPTGEHAHMLPGTDDRGPVALVHRHDDGATPHGHMDDGTVAPQLEAS